MVVSDYNLTSMLVRDYNRAKVEICLCYRSYNLKKIGKYICVEQLKLSKVGGKNRLNAKKTAQIKL